jgi:hypothetical protein
MGKVDNTKFFTDHADWEAIKKKGKKAIENWIDEQMKGSSVTVVLIGNQTSEREFVKYEIKKSWQLNKGLIGIYIHDLLDSNDKTSQKGKNPFEQFTTTINGNRHRLSEFCTTYDPANISITRQDKWCFNTIKDNIEKWVEQAITDIDKRK